MEGRIIKEIPVMVNLTATVSYNGLADDPIQVMTRGSLTPQKDFFVLNYLETQEDEETGKVDESSIQLVLRKDRVTMNRMGSFQNTMMFQRNKHFETVYRTPFGELPMAVETKGLQCVLSRSSGKIFLKYELSMQGTYTSTNELQLEYWANE